MRTVSGKNRIREICADLLQDESSMSGAWCDKAAWPETPEDARGFVEECSRNGTFVTVSGGLTGIAGGALPEGGAVVSTASLKGIETGDDGLILAGAGVTIEELARFVSSNHRGMFYPPDPTEETATVGGTLATDASGADSYLYGSTRNWVQGIEVVLPSGDMMEIHRGEYRFEGRTCRHPQLGVVELPVLHVEQPLKNATGYHMRPDMDLVDLFIGSESTLGLFTRAWLKLAPSPQYVLDLAVFPEDFKQFWNLYDSVLGATCPLRIRALEMMDDRCIDFLRSHPGDLPPPPRRAACVLLIRAEADSEDSLDETLMVLDGMVGAAGIDSDTAWGGFEPSERQKIKDFRHALPESVNNAISHARRTCPSIHKLGSDGAVSPDRLKEYYNRTRSILQDRSLPFVIFGHAGQGHIHANVIPGDLHELALAEEAMREIAASAAEMGGTVSAEHGLGRLKLGFLDLMYTDEEIEGMESIRRTIDPRGLFARALEFSG